MNDLISRQEAINLLMNWSGGYSYIETSTETAIKEFEALPPVKPTLYGFSYQDLELIAIMLQKENLSPEIVKDCLTDIARIIDIVKDEFEEALRKAVEL